MHFDNLPSLPSPRRALGLLALCLPAAGALAPDARAANIVDPISGESIGSAAVYKEFEVNVRNENGDDQALLYRIYRYGAVTQNAPLLVQVHEWGGHFARMEAITKYEKAGLPFVMLAFQWKNVTDNQRNWWYGRVDKASKKTVPFIHNAIIRIVQETMKSSVIQESVGSTVDTNRVYMYGHSIGGTGAVQLGMRHPEVFAAVSVNAGWTLFDDLDRPGGATNKFRNAFTQIIGSTPGVDNEGGYPDEEEVTIAVNADLPQLPPGPVLKAYLYTNLAYYFTQVRNPGWPSPPVFIAQGADDDVRHQGDNLVPVLEAQRRAYTYNRTAEGHEGGGVFVKLDKMYKFRKDQSYLAFTSREYGANSLTQIGYFNDLRVRGWDPATIVDEPGRYRVQLTGIGTSDMTLHRLQRLKHDPGTVYGVRIDGNSAGKVTADEWGLVTIPKVKDSALLELTVEGVSVVRAQAGLGFAVQRLGRGFAFRGLPEGARLAVVDLSGKVLRDLGAAGPDREAAWDGADASGRNAPAGVCFLRVESAGGAVFERLVVSP